METRHLGVCAVISTEDAALRAIRVSAGQVLLTETLVYCYGSLGG